MAELTVEFQPTPNPNAGKFVIGRQVAPVGTSRSYYELEETEEDSVARALMGIDGVRSIFMVDDFITVTKKHTARWDALIPAVQMAIRQEL